MFGFSSTAATFLEKISHMLSLLLTRKKVKIYLIKEENFEVKICDEKKDCKLLLY